MENTKKIKNLSNKECQEITGGLYDITRFILEAIGTAAGNFKNAATTEKSYFVRSTLI